MELSDVLSYIRLIENRRKAGIDIILRYGDIDGEHHKTWVIDQVLQALTDTMEYSNLVCPRCWDKGIAP